MAARTRKALDMMRELQLVKDKEDDVSVNREHPMICLSAYKRLTNFCESCTVNIRRNIACCNHFISRSLSQLISNRMQNYEITNRYVLLGEDLMPTNIINYDNAGFRIKRLLGRDLKMLDPWGAKKHECLVCRTKQLPEERDNYVSFENKLQAYITDKSLSVPTAVEELELYWPIGDRYKLINHYDRADGDVVCGFNENKMFHVYDLGHDKNLLYKDAFLKNLFSDFLRERSSVLCPSIYLACYLQIALHYNNKSTAIHAFQWVYRLLMHHKVCVKL